MITFLLFDYPGIQINVFIYSSILYIIYITHYPKFDPPTVMWSEVVNEAIFILICYHMVLFSNLVWDPLFKMAIGFSLIICCVGLLFGNTIFIAIVSTKGAKQKKRLAFAKMRHSAIMKERQISLKALKSAGKINKMLNEDDNVEVYETNEVVFAHEKKQIKHETDQ